MTSARFAFGKTTLIKRLILILQEVRIMKASTKHGLIFDLSKPVLPINEATSELPSQKNCLPMIQRELSGGSHGATAGATVSACHIWTRFSRSGSAGCGVRVAPSIAGELQKLGTFRGQPVNFFTDPRTGLTAICEKGGEVSIGSEAQPWPAQECVGKKQTINEH